MVAPVVNIEQVGMALPFSLMTGGLSNKLLPKGARESTAGQASTIAGEAVAVGSAIAIGGYALAGAGAAEAHPLVKHACIS